MTGSMRTIDNATRAIVAYVLCRLLSSLYPLQYKSTLYRGGVKPFSPNSEEFAIYIRHKSTYNPRGSVEKANIRSTTAISDRTAVLPTESCQYNRYDWYNIHDTDWLRLVWLCRI